MNQLPMKFFERDVLVVAKDLIGCYLVRKNKDKIERFMITETEAYDGEKDLACHASKGRTNRTEIMFGEAGHAYVYLVYGIHWMFNIVTGKINYPSAVLIRGLKDINGPGRVTKKLNITGKLNGLKFGKETGLWIEKRKDKIPNKSIIKTPRIGVNYAGPIWSKKEYRFVLSE